jgi:hypothetical protein
MDCINSDHLFHFHYTILMMQFDFLFIHFNKSYLWASSKATGERWESGSNLENHVLSKIESLKTKQKRKQKTE